MTPPPSSPSGPESPEAPHSPATLSALATALEPNKYSTQARLYLSKYRALHSLSQTLLSTASDACPRYLHHGCLCFIRADLSTSHELIRQLDRLAGDTRAHAHDIARQAFAASERHERLRRADAHLLERRTQMRWELVARQCQVDAQVQGWNGIVREALRTRRGLSTAGRVGLMMCRARHGLAEQAARKQERRIERVEGMVVASWEKVDRARRLAGFLAEYDECLQSLEWYVDFVARGIEEKVKVLVEEAEETWERKWGEHLAFQRVAGDTLDCPSCLYERWSGSMEFGNRLGWFGTDRTSLEEGREAVKGWERASSM